jgi:DNA ligase D-like protein (predicted 3'-phosphoesterase)
VGPRALQVSGSPYHGALVYHGAHRHHLTVRSGCRIGAVMTAHPDRTQQTPISLGLVRPRPRHAGSVGHKPQTRASFDWGACAPAPVYRGRGHTAPKRWRPFPRSAPPRPGPRLRGLRRPARDAPPRPAPPRPGPRLHAPARAAPAPRPAPPQPRGDILGSVAEPVRFVVQLHDATTLHFDFRLQSGDVLRSWAVPKGPSLDPAVRRLAVPVDDHSLSAGEFEGVHDGQRRGTGAVIIWDEGTADIVRNEPGHVSFILHGRKLSGGFALTRTGQKRWILIKVRDEDARPGSDIVAEQPASVRSGKTWTQLRGG